MVQNRLLQGAGLIRRFSTVLAFLVLSSLSLIAQQTVRGSVKDALTLDPLVGATIVVKGSSTGASTDANGQFSVNASSTDVLVISYLGYTTKTVPVSGAQMEVYLDASNVTIDDVAVTALGISREKKSLGYAVQEISGGSLDKARETNIVSALAGKVAGLTIVGNPSGIGSSARVTIRGERSLNINNNQPLFVVDGVPISNQFVGSSGRSNQEADYGNGAGFVNPDDVESITVLKGASAAALYGARANNGVILITTKTGKNARGLGVTVNSTVTFEDVLRLPDYQNQYGQGLGGNFSFVDGNGGGTADGVDESWGPAYDPNLLLPQFDSPTSNGFRGGDVGNLSNQIEPVNLPAQLARRGEITPTPWIARPDNVRDFFETGLTQTHNVAIAGTNDRGDIRVSYTWLDQTGTVPNTDLNRNTIAFSGGYNLTPKLKVRLVGNYIKNKSDNRPNLSYGTENLMYLFNCWLGRSVDVAAMRDYWQAGRTGLNQYSFNYNYHDNPYFNVFENTNGQDLDRVYGNLVVTYDLNENWSFMARSGTDVSNDFRARRRAYSTQRFPLGSYREEKIYFQETNTDFLATYKKDISERLNFSVSAGGNAMRQQQRYSDVMAPQLAVPGVYTLANSRSALQTANSSFEKRINSLYATGQVGFDNWLYVDLSARNDWSSTLPSDSRSYLYYAANLGLVLSDLFKVPTTSALSYAKLRLGFAQVGNDTDPYQLEQVFAAQLAALGLPTYGESATLVNSTLKPEISTSIETGFELRFLQNRLGIDATYYFTRSRDQILPVQLSRTTGYEFRIINAGEIQNQGVELALNIIPVQKKNFSWNVDINWSLNRSKVIELYVDPVSGQEVTNYVMASRYITVEARKGEQMGDMYGIGFERVSSDPSSRFYDPTGAFVGQMVFNSEGRPIRTSNRIKLGNYNPDWLGGIYNTFTFFGVSVGALFDIRMGGEVYSHTQTVGREGGQIAETLEGRANGYDLSLEGNGVIGDGVQAVYNDEGEVTGYTPNNVKLSAREWHTAYTLGRDIHEGVIYDATFVKLREVRIGYTFPNRLLGRTGIRDLNLAFVGRNLALWTDVPHVDPETASTAGGTIIPGVESVALPSTRSYGLNLNFRF